MSLTSNEVLSERMEAFRRELSDRPRGAPWYAIASRLDEAIVGGSSVGYGADVVKRIAAEATGLSTGVLSRYVAVLRKLKRAAASSGVPLTDLLTPGFNAVEVAARLYETSPHLGLEALMMLADGRAGLSDVKSMSARAPAPVDSRSRTMRHRGVELQVVARALRGHFEGSVVERRPSSEFFRHAGWEIRDRYGECLCGVDALIASKIGTAASEVETLLPAAALLSTYFRRFYIAVSPNSPRSLINELASAVDLFRLDWIGIMVVGPGGSIEIAMEPRASPQPDRSGFYEEARVGLSRRRDRSRSP